MPTNSASVCQCLGCGWRRPLRMSDAYGAETPIAEANWERDAPVNRGWIRFLYVSSLSQSG